MTQAAAIATPGEVVAFWTEAGPDRWFKKDDAFDAAVRDRFLATYQFPRNMFRGSARTYAADPLALTVAGRALSRGDDRTVDPALRTFFYLPFMHSEALADQEQCVALYRALGDAESLRYAEDHADIVRRFGRFPHRNDVLGRATTPEEQAFLDAGGFAG